ncbi:MAG: helix-turn-helix domain-containing protein [Bdellovibrionales bacterium]
MTGLHESEKKAGLAASVERHLSAYFAAHEGALPASGLYDRVLHEIETPLIVLALEACAGNQIRAAALLGLNRNTLRKKMSERGITALRGRVQRRQREEGKKI